MFLKFIMGLVERTYHIVTDTQVQQKETRSHFSVVKPVPDLMCTHILLAKAT